MFGGVCVSAGSEAELARSEAELFVKKELGLELEDLQFL